MIELFFKTPKTRSFSPKHLTVPQSGIALTIQATLNKVTLNKVIQGVFIACSFFWMPYLLASEVVITKEALITKKTVTTKNSPSAQDSTKTATIKMTNGNWPPYQSPNSPYFGAISHAVTEIFKLASIKTDYHFLPDNHALSLTQQGKYDATFLWSFSDERERYFYFSEPIITVNEVILGLHNDSRIIERYEDLISYKIGIVSGYFYGQDFNQASKIYRLKLYQALTAEENLARLLAGKVDFIIGVPEVMSLMLRKHYSHLAFGLQAKNLIIHQSTYHVLFSKASKNVHKWREAFKQGYAIFKENQRLQTIFRGVLQGRYDP